jgi:hypothetical protein
MPTALNHVCNHFIESEVDPMLDLFAQEDEAQAVYDLHNGLLCTVNEF